jgi:hypothetical protein
VHRRVLTIDERGNHLYRMKARYVRADREERGGCWKGGQLYESSSDSRGTQVGSVGTSRSWMTGAIQLS